MHSAPQRFRWLVTSPRPGQTRVQRASAPLCWRSCVMPRSPRALDTTLQTAGGASSGNPSSSAPGQKRASRLRPARGRRSQAAARRSACYRKSIPRRRSGAAANTVARAFGNEAQRAGLILDDSLPANTAVVQSDFDSVDSVNSTVSWACDVFHLASLSGNRGASPICLFSAGFAVSEPRTKLARKDKHLARWGKCSDLRQ